MASNTQPVKHYLVVDSETLGLRPTSAILSIGAVLFQAGKVYEKESEVFYGKVDTKYYKGLAGIFTSDDSTIKWWANQPEHVRKEAFSGEYSLPKVLDEFKAWVEEIKAIYDISFLPVFIKGISLDVPVLQHAFKECRLHFPFHRRELMDSRAYEALFREVVNNVMEANKNSEQKLDTHSAIGDAILQARYMSLIIEQLNAQGLFIESTDTPA